MSVGPLIEEMHVPRLAEYRQAQQGRGRLEAEYRSRPNQTHGVHARQVSIPGSQGIPFRLLRIHARMHTRERRIPVQRLSGRRATGEPEGDGRRDERGHLPMLVDRDPRSASPARSVDNRSCGQRACVQPRPWRTAFLDNGAPASESAALLSTRAADADTTERMRVTTAGETTELTPRLRSGCLVSWPAP
jgi:hypothetical protein